MITLPEEIKTSVILEETTVSTIHLIIKEDAKQNTRAYIIKEGKHSNVIKNEMGAFELLKSIDGCICPLKILKNKNNNTAFLFDYVGTTIHSKIEYFKSSKFFISFSRKLIKILISMHKIDVIHCDIKPENILIRRDNNPCIIDFGNSCYKDGFLKTHNYPLTTLEYRDPERLCDNSIKICKASDVFSLGCTLYYFITGKNLFSRYSDYISRFNMDNKVNISLTLKNFSNIKIKQLVNLIRKMTRFYQSYRILLEDTLSESFFLTIKTKTL